MAVSLSLVLLLLFNSTITTAARNPLSPPPLDPFKAQPPEISFPLTPVTKVLNCCCSRGCGCDCRCCGCGHCGRCDADCGRCGVK
ncbi:hypothetical protein A2U01_0007669 [Trifolium medium]|uniref:Uncharacterized protein n=1 Tax=Trifolium medium TaxID=97028 RepID=A0A392MIB9_9FABA|nr:hypothetical protein [Trifolium medium]